MQKKIILIAGSKNTKEFLLKQLKEFIPDTFIIESYESEGGTIPSPLKCDLLIVSSTDMQEELDEFNIKYDLDNTVVCERTINFDFIDQITDIPVNEEILLVNDEPETVKNSINDLIELGLNHIKYYPYYPGISTYKKLKTAITPGEPDKAPPCVTRVIDMGPRMIGINSLYNIMDKLNLGHRDTTFITKKYMQKIINVSKRIASINNNMKTLNIYLNNIVDSLANGILVIDDNGYIKYANEEMTKLLLLGKNPENKNIRNIVDRDMLPYFLSKDVFENKQLTLMGTAIRMAKFNVPDSNNIVVTTNREKGDNVKKTFSNDLLLKGHYAKHNFEDIIGSSYSLNETKNTALKLAKSDLTVLIEGESGTGKELFASAIHNSSKRKYGPFLALNFSALPDELIESELFGYEEGAFTGAKKGGKIGLFELADGGTIFLDEIGDVSPKLQTKLLRVLQEKEIMPIGGTAIRRVDVRIIAATNKNLKDMVLEKEFRADLYYRLKIGYINLPPLRERLSDIDILVSYFMKSETAADIKISESVLNEFKKYKWYGNVRELESTIKYMVAVRTGNVLSLSEMPDSKFFEEEMIKTDKGSHGNVLHTSLGTEMDVILNSILYFQKNNIVAGRDILTRRLNDCGHPITESQMRTRLNNLEKGGYIIKKRGRQGTLIADRGIKYLENITN